MLTLYSNIVGGIAILTLLGVGYLFYLSMAPD